MKTAIVLLFAIVGAIAAGAFVINPLTFTANVYCISHGYGVAGPILDQYGSHACIQDGMIVHVHITEAADAMIKAQRKINNEAQIKTEIEGKRRCLTEPALAIYYQCGPYLRGEK